MQAAKWTPLPASLLVRHTSTLHNTITIIQCILHLEKGFKMPCPASFAQSHADKDRPEL
jgi:hypothetical protein